MTNFRKAQLPIYPPHCHVISPTFGKWCPLQAQDVLNLRQIRELEGQQIYFHLNHPIKYIRLTGVIVAIDEYESISPNAPGRWIATLDDSSGINIECVCAAPPKKPAVDKLDATVVTCVEQQGEEQRISPDGPVLTGIDVGSVVKMKGGIREFRDRRQMRLLAIHKVGDTNAEVKAWREMVAFKNEVLSRPWVVSAEDEEECKREEVKRLIEEREEERRAIREAAEQKNKQLKRELRKKKKELEERFTDEKEKEKREDRQRRKQHELQIEIRKDKSITSKPSKELSLARAARLRAAGKYDALGL